MARKQHGPELHAQIRSSTPTPGQRQARSTSWRPYSGRAGDPDAQQRARNILHDLAGNGLRAAEQELLSTSAAQEESSRGNPRSGKRAPPRRRSSAVSVTWSQTPDVSELAAERGMNRSASPPFLSGEDSLSPQPSFSSLSSARSSSSGTPLRRSSLTPQRSFSSLSSAPSSQPSSGTPLRPSSRLSKPEHTHSKDSSLTVVGARRAILSLSGMPIPAEDIIKDTSRTGSEADEYAVPPRPRSRLGLHRSSSSIKTQPELPFESAMGSLSQPLPTVPPQLPLQPPSPVPSTRATRRNDSWSRKLSTRLSLDGSRDGEVPKPNRNSVTLFPDQHVRNPWEPIKAPFRHTALPPLQLDVPQTPRGWPVPRQVSSSSASRHAEAAAAAARLLCPGPQKEAEIQRKAERKIRRAASQGGPCPENWNS